MQYKALAKKLSPPWLQNSTEYPKLIYMEMSCSAQNIGQINLIFYENVLGIVSVAASFHIDQF